MRHLTIFGVLVLAALPLIKCKASEKDKLALVRRDLDQVPAGLARARGGEKRQQQA